MTPLSEKEKQVLLRFKQILLDRFGSQIVGMRLFGSKARGDAHPDSDIDVLVVTRRDDWKLKDEIGKVVTSILLEESIYLSVKVLGMPSFRRLTRLSSPFLKNISRDGIPLCNEEATKKVEDAGRFIKRIQELLRDEKLL